MQPQEQPDLDQLKADYGAFFVKNASGKHFMSVISKVIVDNHEKAEDNPELSRDHVQRAKGAREVLLHITNVLNTEKGGKPK